MELTNLVSLVSLSRVPLCNPMYCSMPGLPVHHHLPEFTQTHVHQVSDGIQPSHPLSSPSPPAPSPSQHQSQLFAGGGQSTGVSALASVLPGLISFRMDWLDLLAVQRTLKSLLQHHSSKASILWLSVFFMARFSQLYMIIGKTIALTIQTLSAKWCCLSTSNLCCSFLPFSYTFLIQILYFFYTSLYNNLTFLEFGSY